jgi:hypothetical protein
MVMTTTGKNRIMIYGPKEDGTYVVEFKTAAGQAMAISIPRTEAAVIRHFQERMPYGLYRTCPSPKNEPRRSGARRCPSPARQAPGMRAGTWLGLSGGKNDEQQPDSRLRSTAWL